MPKFNMYEPTTTLSLGRENGSTKRLFDSLSGSVKSYEDFLENKELTSAKHDLIKAKLSTDTYARELQNTISKDGESYSDMVVDHHRNNSSELLMRYGSGKANKYVSERNAEYESIFRNSSIATESQIKGSYAKNQYLETLDSLVSGTNSSNLEENLVLNDDLVSSLRVSASERNTLLRKGNEELSFQSVLSSLDMEDTDIPAIDKLEYFTGLSKTIKDTKAFTELSGSHRRFVVNKINSAVNKYKRVGDLEKRQIIQELSQRLKSDTNHIITTGVIREELTDEETNDCKSNSVCSEFLVAYKESLPLSESIRSYTDNVNSDVFAKQVAQLRDKANHSEHRTSDRAKNQLKVLQNVRKVLDDSLTNNSAEAIISLNSDMQIINAQYLNEELTKDSLKTSILEYAIGTYNMNESDIKLMTSGEIDGFEQALTDKKLPSYLSEYMSEIDNPLVKRLMFRQLMDEKLLPNGAEVIINLENDNVLRTNLNKAIVNKNDNVKLLGLVDDTENDTSSMYLTLDGDDLFGKFIKTNLSPHDKNEIMGASVALAYQYRIMGKTKKEAMPLAFNKIMNNQWTFTDDGHRIPKSENPEIVDQRIQTLTSNRLGDLDSLIDYSSIDYGSHSPSSTELKQETKKAIINDMIRDQATVHTSDDDSGIQLIYNGLVIPNIYENDIIPWSELPEYKEPRVEDENLGSDTSKMSRQELIDYYNSLE